MLRRPSGPRPARLARLRPKRFLNAFKVRFGLPPVRYRYLTTQVASAAKALSTRTTRRLYVSFTNR